MGKLNPERGLLILVLIPEAGVGAHGIGKEGVVLGQIDHMLGLVLGGEGGALGGAHVLGVPATQLDPLGQLLDAGRQPMGRVRVGIVGTAESLRLFARKKKVRRRRSYVTYTTHVLWTP